MSVTREPPCLVLVIDDEPGLRDLLTLLLEMEGYRVVGVPNGQRALEQLRDRGFDLVITDYMMPGMDGLKLIEAMRGDDAMAGIPIILTSAAGIDELRATPGIDAFVRKPYDVPRLLSVIEGLLAH